MINSQSGVYSFKDKEQVLGNKIIFIGRKKMSPQNKYRDEIIKELEDIPDEDMPKLLEIIHSVKRGMKVNKKKLKVERGKDPLLDLKNIAVDTGIKDLAENHDHYLYGVPK